MYEISSGRDYSLKRVKADSTRTHLLPRSSSCVHVCARLHVPIYTHKRRIVEPVVVNGSACRGLGQLGLPSIAGQLFLVSSYRCIPDMHPRLHCADTWSGIHRNCTFTRTFTEYSRVAWSRRLPRIGRCRKTLVMENDILLARVALSSMTRTVLKFATKRTLFPLFCRLHALLMHLPSTFYERNKVSDSRVGRQQIFSSICIRKLRGEKRLWNVSHRFFYESRTSIWRIYLEFKRDLDVNIDDISNQYFIVLFSFKNQTHSSLSSHLRVYGKNYGHATKMNAQFQQSSNGQTIRATYNSTRVIQAPISQPSQDSLLPSRN